MDFEPPIEIDSNDDVANAGNKADDQETDSEPEPRLSKFRPNVDLRQLSRGMKAKPHGSYMHRVSACRVRTQSIYDMTVRDRISRYRLAAEEAITKVLKQLLDKGVFRPVHMKDITVQDNRRQLIPSKMFLKDKYKADGSFDKIKARRGAGGHRRIPMSRYHPQRSTWLMSLSLAWEQLKVVTADIGTAHPNAWMKKRVLMRINREVSQILMKITPE